MKENSWNVRYYTFKLTVVSGSTPEPTVVPLPIIAKGNQDTKVEGAGAWIYLDVTGLTLTAEMASAMAAAAQIQLTVAMTEDTPESAQSAASRLRICKPGTV